MYDNFTIFSAETPAEGNVENDVESADADEHADENGNAKEEQQTDAPVEVSSEQPRGLSEISCLLFQKNKKKIMKRNF